MNSENIFTRAVWNVFGTLPSILRSNLFLILTSSNSNCIVPSFLGSRSKLVFLFLFLLFFINKNSYITTFTFFTKTYMLSCCWIVCWGNPTLPFGSPTFVHIELSYHIFWICDFFFFLSLYSDLSMGRYYRLTRLFFILNFRKRRDAYFT